MSYCPIDEAFGNYLTEDLNPNPLESSVYQGMNSNNCVKKKKIKKKKINCNKNNSRFTSNYEDLFYEPPDKTDSDEEFDRSISPYSHYDEVNNYNIANEMKMPISKKKKSKRTDNHNNNIRPTISSKQYNSNSNIIETFSNENEELTIPIKRKNKARSKNVPKNEIFEYDPNDDLPLSELNTVNNINNNFEEDDTDEEATPIAMRHTEQIKNSNNNSGMNSQINEINNKINFILNQISNNDNEIVESQHNNIHDIILFVIFGIFVLIILESLYRLISKMVKANHILNNSNNYLGNNHTSNMNHNPNPNPLVSESKSFFSTDPFEKVKSFAKSKE